MFWQAMQGGMRMKFLPGTTTLVSELAFGTMTFGDQVQKDDALLLLDEAVYKYGVNFLVRMLRFLTLTDIS
jgi:hypothetical protein